VIGGESPEKYQSLPGGSYTPPTGDRGSKILGPLKAEGVRGVTIAVVSTIVVFGLLAFVILNSSGWPQVKEAFFDPEVFWESLGKILAKFGRDVFIFVVAEIFVLMLALLVAVLRSLRGPVFTPLRIMAAAYTDLFRAVPTILVIFLLGFGAPALQIKGVPHSDLFWAIVALVLVYSAYVAEVYRAGIQSIHPSQVASARALGLSRGKTMRFVVIPQAVRRVIPPLLNDFIGLQKDAALVAFLGYTEGLREASIISAAKFDFTPYVALAVVYIVITIPEARFVDWLVARDQRRRQVVGGV
jgi:polar amino acid transport system permease protein